MISLSKFLENTAVDILGMVDEVSMDGGAVGCGRSLLDYTEWATTSVAKIGIG